MAPSATETVTLSTRPAEHTQVKLTSNTGPYKELAPIGYEKEAEEQGKYGFQAAKVFDSLILAEQKLSNQYRNYLSTRGNEKYPPLQLFENYDPGLDADTSYLKLLAKGVTTTLLQRSVLK